MPGGRFCMGASPAPRMGWPSRDRAADGVCFAACRCLDFLRLFRLRRFREVGGGGGGSPLLTGAAIMGASAAIRMEGVSGIGASGTLVGAEVA